MNGCAIWLTGIPASGKTTLAGLLAERLRRAGARVEILDGDEIRKGLSRDLGFSKADREEHNRRVIFVAKLLARNGVVTIIPLISPYRAVRAEARREIPAFVEVWVRCSLSEAIRRDPKGLYRKALAGEITDLTGLQDTYEAPEAPDLIVDTDQISPEEAATRILDAAAEREFVPREALAFS
ncbi:MAG TPA: adenylyl-sulfate kinase [bacterium]|nr:adenylyl-sulfate kinase [bacterium]